MCKCCVICSPTYLLTNSYWMPATEKEKFVYIDFIFGLLRIFVDVEVGREGWLKTLKN